jgi:suppressor of fused protein SUFU
MTPEEAKHRQLTMVRAQAYAVLFGVKPDTFFPAHQLGGTVGGADCIDVFVYPMEMEGVAGPIYAAVTNEMSDQRMAEGDSQEQPRRRELIQYLRKCTLGHAKRLRDMARLPLHDGFVLDTHHSVAWEWPAVEGTPWENAFFLLPLINPHAEFTFEIEGEPVSFLWHIPISDEERAFKQEQGSDAFLDRMPEARLPWIFDEANRPPLVE